MNDTDVFDLAVIGSGGAAMAAAIAARQAGKTVGLIEQATLGGTCVNVGCVPSKTLLAAAGARHSAVGNPFPGAPTSAGPVDLGALVGQKDELVGRLRQAKYADVATAHGFEIRPGHARFTSEDTLVVNGQPVAARAYLIATGADPADPGLPGLEEVDWLSSTTAMELTALPESLVVIGGGYVGMEQAQLFAHLGARVTLVGRLAPAAEPEVADALRGVFADDGITVVEDRAVAVETVDGQVVVVTRSGQRVSGARLLVATGRSPRTATLGLDVAGVKTDGRGFVVVDERQASSNPRIFAAGDVAGGPQYVYVAAATGRAAALNATAAAGARPAVVDYTGMPGVVFTRPQLGSAGLTEAQALEAGYRCVCRVLHLVDVPRALANGDTRGVVKLVADAETGRVLGVHAAADAAGELMLAATYAIKAAMTVDEVADTWAPYLTMAESLRIAAGLFRTDMPTSCCA
ncbi:mercury(II) reductase [Pseudonocardia sp. 73-21]|uniref:mercury(II) reductase n=1 Tax=Pseudonocardia sp. 73-21 TaxID=1895809 RepID=UPI000A3F8A21|nr:mercury(II) reductase [Pseudonocardia sp. 73-21]